MFWLIDWLIERERERGRERGAGGGGENVRIFLLHNTINSSTFISCLLQMLASCKTKINLALKDGKKKIETEFSYFSVEEQKRWFIH